MNLDQITTKCWILALIIRDDGERLLLGDGWFDFKDSLQHFQPNSIANDIVELQGTDGQLLAGQVRRSASQSFDGYIGDALTSKTEIENRRRQFIQFFRTRRHYKVIYIFPDGTAIQRRMGYLTDAPSVPEMWQKFPEYHVALNFEDVNYYEYAEDAQGDEIYAHDSLVKLINVQSGGLVWDEYGAVSHGYTWLDPQTVTGDYITVTDGATGSPLTLSQLLGNAEQTTYSGKNLISTRPSSGSANGITWSLNSDGSVKVSGTATATQVIGFGSVSMEQGKTYTLSGCPSGGAVGKYMLYTNIIEPQFVDTGSGATQTVSANGGAQIYFIVYSGRTIDGTIYPQCELGSTATDYEPYVGGIPSPNPSYPQPISTVTGEQTVKVGKNLVNINATTTNFNASTSVSGQTITVTSSSSSYVARVLLPLTYEANRQMTLSFDATVVENTTESGLISQVCLRTPDGSDTLGNIRIGTTVGEIKHYRVTVTANNNTRWLWLYIKATGVAGTIKVEYSNIQLEYGGSETSYEAYQAQDFPIDLGSIELAKIGTYQDRIYKDSGKWYVEKQVGKVVLDGSESWGGINNNALFYSGISDIYKPGANTTPYVMSNNYSPAPYQTMYSELVDYGVGAHDTQNRVLIRNKDCDSTSALKTWLGTNKPSVYYALATPTTTQITDETLLSQLNFIASLYEGVNNISIVGTGAQGEMTLNYYADVDTTGAGYEWESGEGGGPTIVQAIGVDDAQPIWTVTGPATNPTLTNITTVQTITWNGTVPNGQKLIVDMANQTATLAGANVYEFITGSWLTLRPGANKLTYSAQGADQASQIQWNGVVG